MNYYETEEFEIEELGYIEDYVYDIEVEDNHNFFANDILVHNSQYLSLDRLIEKKFPNASEEEILAWIQDFYKTTLQPEINKLINKIATQFNFYKEDVLKMDQEVITTSFCSIASKRYFCRVKVNDGNVLASPKEKVTGVSLVSKSTPKQVKKILKPILKYILDHDEINMQKYIKEQADNFGQMTARDLSKASSVTSVENWEFVTKDNRPVDWMVASKVAAKKEGKWQTAPINSRGAVVFNKLIEERNLTNKFEPIINLDKIFMTYLTVPNPITGMNDVISFKDVSIFKETGLDEYIDYQKQWEKEVLNKIKILTNTIGWKTEAVASLDDW